MMRYPALVLLAAAAALAACSAEAPDPGTPGPATAPAPTAPSSTTEPDTTAELPEVRYYLLDDTCPYCKDITAVIQGGKSDIKGPPLAEVYEGRVTFSIRSAYDKQNNPTPDAAELDFGPSGHGLVVVAPSGDVLVKFPGHHLNRAKMIEIIDKSLE